MRGQRPSPTSGGPIICKYGVTLIELLVTLTIIAVLAAIIAPVYINAIDGANRTKCAHHIRQIGDAVLAYDFEYGRLPGPLSRNADDENQTLEDHLANAGYIISKDIWLCPSSINARGTGEVATKTSFVLHNSQRSQPSFFFGSSNTPRTVSAHQIKLKNPEGAWLIRDTDIKLTSSSFEPGRSPGTGENRPPHAKGRNYFFVDGHVKHLKIGAFPTNDVPDGNTSGNGSSGGGTMTPLP